MSLIGSIFEDNDPRHEGRRLRVVREDDRFVWCIPARYPDTYRETRIRKDRLFSNRQTGYKLVQDGSDNT